MKDATLCFIVSNRKILLGLKKRGFGKGKLNGFGGKVEKDETVEAAAVRELYEETGIIASTEHLKKVGELTFVFPHIEDNKWDQIVHVFIVGEWKGEAKETDEMMPLWVNLDELPFDKMWDDDKHWLPLVLDGRKVVATFVFNRDNNVSKMEIKENN